MSQFIAIAPEVYRLALPFPGCWTGVVLVKGKENILVDSGGDKQAIDTCLVPALKKMGMDIKDISWLLMTHIHGDHVGGCMRIMELAPEIRLAVYHESLQRMRQPLAYSKEIREKFPKHSPSPPAVLGGAQPDRLLKDGDMVGDLRLLHTPGHDTDSCCYWHEKTCTLITGDSLQLNGTISQGCSLLMDAVAYTETVKRLLGMDIHHIICGHPYLPLGSEAIGKTASFDYLMECLSLAAYHRGFVHGMMAAGQTDAPIIARKLIQEIGGTEPQHLFLPMYTVTQYMEGRKEK